MDYWKYYWSYEVYIGRSLIYFAESIRTEQGTDEKTAGLKARLLVIQYFQRCDHGNNIAPVVNGSPVCENGSNEQEQTNKEIILKRLSWSLYIIARVVEYDNKVY